MDLINELDLEVFLLDSFVRLAVPINLEKKKKGTNFPDRSGSPRSYHESRYPSKHLHPLDRNNLILFNGLFSHMHPGLPLDIGTSGEARLK